MSEARELVGFARVEGEESGEDKTFREFFSDKGRVNTPHEEIYAQIRKNIRRPLPQVSWHIPNDYKVALLCGGPSLNEAPVEELHEQGYKFATVNNSYNWLLDKGFTPSVYVQLDAREFNKRFVEQPIDECRYLLCSQVHPAVFEALEGFDVHIWHGTLSKQERRIFNKYYMKRWLPVSGGSSAGSRAISLLHMLGMRTIKVWGMDSSFADDGMHHAYPQAENDRDVITTVSVNGKLFKSCIWMLAQLDEFFQLADKMPDDLDLSFEGNGLLQFIVKETARLGHFPEVKIEG